jgi:cytoskeletal protein RodZ
MNTMKLFNRQNKQSSVPPELQPYYEASPSSAKRGWVFWALRILALVIIVALIVWGALWGWHRLNTHTGTTPPAKSQVNQPPSENNIPKPSGQPAKTPSSNSTNSGTVQPPSGTLPNTGG